MSESVQKTRKSVEGVVVSNAMDQTAVVQVDRLVRHPLYGKYIRKKSKYMAHDPENSCTVGDKVLIEECRPLSKNKRWRLSKVIEQAV